MDSKCAIEDIRCWTSILIDRFGFTRENIRLLYNHRATKVAVIQRLKWLKSGVRQGDTIVFLFTGHGTTFTERDWYGHLDEEKDEGLCLACYDLIIDDELNLIFSNISREVNVTVICDSCYSGGVGNNDKYLPEPIDIAHRSDPGSPVRAFGHRLSTSLLLAACGEKEQALQATVATKGLSVFSYYATQAILSSEEDLTALQFIECVKADIKKAGHSQVPELKGRVDFFDRPLFRGLSSN